MLYRRAEVRINQRKDTGYQHQEKGRHEMGDSEAHAQHMHLRGHRLELL